MPRKIVGQRDDHDRLVDRRHQDPERRVRQRDPLVAVVRVGSCAGRSRVALADSFDQDGRGSRRPRERRRRPGCRASPSPRAAARVLGRAAARTPARRRRSGDQHRAAVTRVDAALHPAALGEPVDQQRDPGLGDALLVGELGDPARPLARIRSTPTSVRETQTLVRVRNRRESADARCGSASAISSSCLSRTPAVVSSIAPLY